MQLTVSYQFLPRGNSTRASVVMDHFGIDFEQGRHVIAEQLPLPAEPGQIVLFTGESGSGKSSLLRAAAAELEAGGRRVLHLDQLVWEERILVDLLPLEIEQTLQLLAACGLGEAQLLLRTPAELSDGQRYRFRLALALAQRPDWIAADEFTATLDRRLAKVVAFNLRRLAARMGTGFLLATTHDEVTEDLAPDVHVNCRLDGTISIAPAPSAVAHKDVKKKGSRSPGSCGSPPRPSPTGRTSLGGITAVTASG
jgi:ABC-type ATPase with predicted acetyltransferase domain